MKRWFPIVLLVIFPVALFSQVVYQDISYSAIYDFLDELANLKVITLNSAEKPWSKQYIADKLQEARMNGGSLTGRQKSELAAYSCDYGFYSSGNLQSKDSLAKPKCGKDWNGLGYDPPGYRFRKGIVRLELQPVIGLEFITNSTETISWIQGGGRLSGYIGNHIGYYAGIISRRQSDSLVFPQYFSKVQGVDWKSGRNGAFTNTEFTGGVSVRWQWGDFGFYKDRLIWGNNYNGSNILSGRPPSFPFIQLHIHPAKWIELSYIHGWLTSNVIDSSRSTLEGSSINIIYLHKYIAANLITLIPWKGVGFSLGNSVIYESQNPQLAFLLPFVFYNSIDATLSGYNNNAGQNNQLFFDISVRKIKHLHLYGTLFIDEISFSNLYNSKKESTLVGFKTGFRLAGFPLKNVTLTAEYTRSNPLVYKHFIPSLTFSSDDYCLGYFLRDNSEDVYIGLSYKPLKGLSFDFSYTLQKHGNDYAYTGPNQGYPFLQETTWKEIQYSVRTSYRLINNSCIFIEYLNTDQTGVAEYSPAVFRGSTNTIIAGVNVGF
jgi:hypothetical protein